jgi:hypothetical protein
MADCLVIHVNPSASGALDGVSIHDAQTERGFNGARVGNGTVLCFIEDPRPGVSTITGFQVSKESCGSCKVVAGPVTNALYLSFSPSIGNADTLLLNATAAGKTYSASRNGNQIDGGKPIIRNTLELPFLVAALAMGAAILGYLAWRIFVAPERMGSVSRAGSG